MRKTENVKRYEQLKDEGICVQCGLGKPTFKKPKCDDCLSARRRKTLTLTPSAPKKYRVLRTRSLKEAGKCVNCGRRDAAPGKTCCEPCLAAMRLYAKERRAARTR